MRASRRHLHLLGFAVGFSVAWYAAWGGPMEGGGVWDRAYLDLLGREPVGTSVTRAYLLEVNGTPGRLPGDASGALSPADPVAVLLP